MYLFLIPFTLQVNASQHYKLLVLHSDPQNYPAVSYFNEGMQHYFEHSDFEVTIYYENFDSSNSGNSVPYRNKFSQLLELKYKDHLPDAIICTERDVAIWYSNYLPSIFKDIPSFYLGGIYDLEKLPSLNTIEVMNDIKDCFRNIMDVLPSTKHIYYFTDKFTHQRLVDEFGQVDFNVDIHIIQDKTPKEIAILLKNLPKQSVAFYQYIHKNRKENFIPFNALKKISKDLQIPLFVNVSHYIIDDVLGGKCIDFNKLGYKTAACIDSTIMSKTNHSNNYRINTSRFIYNQRALDKFNISTSHLPDNSSIINSHKTIWDYWIPISLFLALAIIEAISIVILLWQRKKTKAAELLVQQINNELENTIDGQVSEIKKQNILLKEKHEKILVLQKYKELISNMIVHDLKNPLSVILNYNRINNYKLREELVQGAGKNMLSLISNIMDMYKLENRPDQLKFNTFSVSKLIKQALNEMIIPAQGNCIIINTQNSYDGLINADIEILTRVLINLISNAIKNSPSRSTIQISTEYLEKEKMLKIIVSDCGTGIDEALIDTIFTDPQKTKKTDRLSSGLGLTFCSVAVSTFKGSIGVKNNTDIGASFWFTIPYKEKFDKPFNYVINDEKRIDDTNACACVDIKYIEKLRKLKVFQFTEIQAILNKINVETNKNTLVFIAKIRTAIRLCDEELYLDTLNELEKRTKQ